MFEVSRSANGHARSEALTFPDEPYVIDGLKPGLYSLRVRFNQQTRFGPKGTWADLTKDVVVAKGVTADVTLSVSRGTGGNE